ncbi:hypothetical protein BJV78DRAFT_1209785, partial [Lactifluus subvellereus]
ENVTDEADKCYELAVQVSDRYEKTFIGRRYKSIIEIMSQAEWRDAYFLQNLRLRMDIPTDESLVARIPVDFVIFRTLPDPTPIIIRRKYRRTKLVFYCLIHVLEMLVSRSDVSEALWNFSCFEGNRRRVFLETEQRTDVFGSVFMLKDVMIFKDVRGTLRGEMMIKTDIRRTPYLWHYEQRPTSPAQYAPGNHRTLQPITTAPWNSPGAGGSSENWRDLICSTWQTCCPFTAPAARHRPQNRSGAMTAEEERGILLALQQYDRILCIITFTMDKPFVGLEHLSLLSTTEEDTRLTLPNTSRTVDRFLHPPPPPRAERELLRVPIVRVTLPALKRVIFRGVGAYLESLIARISSPLLERLSITLYNQINYTLPHLSHFTVSTEGLRHPVGKVTFGKDAVSIVTGHRDEPGDGNFNLHISCKEFDWQIDSSARVCDALMPVLSFVEELTFGFDEHRMPSAWQDAVDGMVWHGLLLPFRGVRKLRVGGTLALELSSALDLDEAGLVLELLPELQEIEAHMEDEHAKNAFTRFVEARQLAGRPVRLSTSLIPHAPPTEAFQLIEDKSPPTESSQLIPDGSPSVSRPVGVQRNWFRRAVVDRVRRRPQAGKISLTSLSHVSRSTGYPVTATS